MLEPGTRLGPYAVVAPLGSGGMGEVYLADDARLGRKAAIKILPPQFRESDERVRRFEHEARTASTLNHPNIVTIYDIGETNGVCFIAMEYVAGRTLGTFCGEPLPVETVSVWGAQIARALEAAHAAGIVHRDIKPDNVIIRDDGYVKLLDFGVALLTRPDSSRRDAVTAAATHPGMLVGTLRYMAPEHLDGQPATAASDVFALGILLYELATGRHPVNADTLMELARWHASGTPIAPLLPSVPADFDELVMRMLAADPSRRPLAGEVARTLDGLRHAMVPAPAPPTVRWARSKTVGRERERRVLQEALAAAVAGRGSIVGVAGEPGIGKTTLVEDALADTSMTNRWRVARGRCSERLAGTEAYLPWLEALDPWRHGDRSDATMQAMRRIAPTWYAQIARETDAKDASLLAEIRSASQERLKRELALLLEEWTNQLPYVLFFDDIHWADASTIDLLAFIAARLGDMRLLIVVTYRPTDLQLARHPFLLIRPDLQARGVCRELVLDFLSEPDVAAFLELEYPEHQFPPAFRALIHERTEGSPLFMVDLTRDLRDRGVIARDGGVWQLARPLAEIERDLPESVRGMIERKITQVSDEDRKILIAASVQGYQFDSATVAGATGLDQSQVEDRLDILERVHAFVLCLGDEERPDHSLTLRYRFVHVLYQEALYGSLRATKRVALSSSVAQALRTAYGDHVDRVAPALAMLFEASRDFARAAEYCLHAARHATRVFANHEAVALAQRGLLVSQQIQEEAMRARLQRDLLVALGWPLINVRGYPAVEVEAAYTRARQAHGRTGEAVEPYQAVWGLAMCYLARAQYARTQSLADEILRLAGITGDPGARITAHYMMGTVLFYLGDIRRSRDHHAKGIALADADPLLILPDGRDPNVSCRAQSGRVLWLLGYPAQARAMLDDAVARARRADQPLALAFALFLDMLGYQVSRDIAGAARSSQELLLLAGEHHLAQYRAWAGIVRGWATAASDARAGIEHMRKSLADYDRLGNELARPHFLALLAEALGADGRATEGLAALHEALASVERTGERYYLPEVLRLRGELILRADDAERASAVSAFADAIAEARRQEARSWELRVSLSVARSASVEARAAALAQLEDCYRTFTEGFDEPDLCDARRLLDEQAS